MFLLGKCSFIVPPEVYDTTLANTQPGLINSMHYSAAEQKLYTATEVSL